jgi:hypothetical protein
LGRVRNNLNTSNHLLKEILNSIYSAKDVTSKISNEIPRFTLYVLETYKISGIHILQDGKIYYICYKRNGTNDLYDVVTCYFGEEKFNMFKNSELSREEIFIKIKQIKYKLKK